MGKKHGPNKANLEATRRVFLNIARKEFSTQGYYNASTAHIVEESGMARGSLYYHFGDKKGLFRAVYEELMTEMRDAVKKDVAGAKDSWDAFIVGGLKILDFCMTNEIRRIVIDVHTALSYRERLEVLQRTLLYELRAVLQGVYKMGYFKGHDPRSLSIMIFGILSEGGRSLELADDIHKARDALGKSFVLLMEAARE
ncbi:MAG TPA: TetR/AcrR family transcriptional regulator [Micavibrio sp.]|nr:TetR/AcrR family transcriptional regulator [Micavibrio sp.]